MTVDEDPYIRQAIKHLRPVFRGWDWSIELGVMLVTLPPIYKIEFVHKFVFNGDDSFTIVGNRDAAAIVAALAPRPFKKDAGWWLARNSTSGDLEFPPHFFETVLGRIVTHPSVKSIGS